jgi:predicted AAA+ superfamily ATPase
MEIARQRSPVTVLLGPPQAGKTTLARLFRMEHPATHFDLEAEADRQQLQNPELALGSLKHLAILDEIQRMPEILDILPGLVNQPGSQVSFMILSSVMSPQLRQVLDSLAGKVEVLDLSGYNLMETGGSRWEKLWLRGALPPSFDAESESASFAWREDHLRNLLESDLPSLGMSIPVAAKRRFLSLLAQVHGQTLNTAELSRNSGFPVQTVRQFLDILSSTFRVRLLQPWHEEIAKRQNRLPRLFLRDSGLLHCLLNLPDRQGLLAHPKAADSWRGFAIEQALNILQPQEAYFGAARSGTSLDLLYFVHEKRFGIKTMFSEAPKVTRSMHQAVETLGLEHLWILYPGERSDAVSEQISVVPIRLVERLVGRSRV